jgi:glutamate:Na+ symporter, ESS family
MSISWTLIIDLGIISLALLLSTFLRAKIPFFQKYLIPNALTAGFILLPFYNYLFPLLGMGKAGLESLVFHLLNLSFVAMALKEGSMKGSGKRIYATAVSIVSHYTIQIFLGLGITAIFMATLMPKLFINFGFFLALGYGLGPGQSFMIGKSWESAGFAGAGNLGLIFAAMGYIWACIGGIYLINLGRRKGWIDRKVIDVLNAKGLRTGIFGKNETPPVGSLQRTDTEAIDSLSYNLALVLGVYVVSFLLLKLITWPIGMAGAMGKQLADSLWGISFIFAAMTAMLVKKLMKTLKIDFTIDEGSMNRVAGASVDLMLAAAVASIAISVVVQYWLPLVVIGIVGGVVTTVFCLWTTSRLFEKDQFGRAILMYGNMTGTLSSGIALLRVIDPEFKTSVASDYMFSNGITFLLAIPMLLLINLPIQWYNTGNIAYLWICIGGFAVYLVFSVVSYVLLAGKRGFAKFGQLWYKG